MRISVARTLPLASLSCLLGVPIGADATTASEMNGYQIVAVSGMQAPGLGPGLTVENMVEPTINASGVVGFLGGIDGIGVTRDNSTVVLNGTPGSLGLVAREGSQAPGANPGAVWRFFTGPTIIDGQGNVSFASRIIGPVGSVGDEAKYLGSPGNLVEIVREGDRLPDLRDGRSIVSGFNLSGNLALNASSQFVFNGTIAGQNQVTSAVFTGTTGDLHVVAESGSRAPLAPEQGTVFGGFSTFINFDINKSGRVAFLTRLEGPRINNANDRAVYLYQPIDASLTGVAFEGGQAPGAAAGVVYSNLGGRVSVNTEDQVIFSSALDGPGVDASNNIGWYLYDASTTSPIARLGDQAPGAAPGVVFSEFTSIASLSDLGQAAFRTELSGPGVDAGNDNAIILADPDMMVQIIREGDQAPDAGPGVLISRLSDPVINKAGQAAFFSTLTGAGVDDSNDSALYAVDKSGRLSQIVRTGQAIDINDDPMIEELKVISDIDQLTSQSQNETGQIVFAVSFTDRTRGVLISDLATVPEPGSLALLLAAGVGALARRRRS